MKKKKITGIKKAVSEYQHWIVQDLYSRCGKIMLDTDTGEVWADCFLDRNTWKEYHDPVIIPIAPVYKNMTVPVNMKNIRAIAEEIMSKNAKN